MKTIIAASALTILASLPASSEVVAQFGNWEVWQKNDGVCMIVQSLDDGVAAFGFEETPEYSMFYVSDKTSTKMESDIAAMDFYWPSTDETGWLEIQTSGQEAYGAGKPFMALDFSEENVFRIYWYYYDKEYFVDAAGIVPAWREMLFCNGYK